MRLFIYKLGGSEINYNLDLNKYYQIDMIMKESIWREKTLGI